MLPEKDGLMLAIGVLRVADAHRQELVAEALLALDVATATITPIEVRRRTQSQRQIFLKPSWARSETFLA
jgi:hypothetical protein